MKRLTIGLIKRRHKDQPKKLTQQIEKKEVDRGLFGRLLKRAAETEPFDQKMK